MENLYNKNGLIFWSEKDIKFRKFIEEQFSTNLMLALKEQNVGFSLIQVEAPILTPIELINKNYTTEDMYVIDDLVLRPETTMGSFEAAKNLLSTYNDIKYKPPIVVYQHGKSFRKEQDQPTKFMRLKEFYQLEFQIIYSEKTFNDYSIKLYPKIQEMISNIIGDCYIEKSDRLPDYSEEAISITL
jgi:glycyl-tRNA synthetase